jgi:hypothetical protein
MVQRALIGAADVHAGLFAYGFEALELAEFRRVVRLCAARGRHILVIDY